MQLMYELGLTLELGCFRGCVAFVFVIVCFTFSNGVVIKTGTYSVSILGMNAIDMSPMYEDVSSYFED